MRRMWSLWRLRLCRVAGLGSAGWVETSYRPDAACLVEGRALSVLAVRRLLLFLRTMRRHMYA